MNWILSLLKANFSCCGDDISWGMYLILYPKTHDCISPEMFSPVPNLNVFDTCLISQNTNKQSKHQVLSISSNDDDLIYCIKIYT